MTNNNNMILYNITINIDSNVANVWLDYMKTKHISDVLKTGLFIKCKLCRIHAEEDGGHSYSIQYFLKSLEGRLVTFWNLTLILFIFSSLIIIDPMGTSSFL